MNFAHHWRRTKKIIGVLLILLGTFLAGYFAGSDEPFAVLSCSTPILKTDQEFAGVAKKFALKKNPSLTWIDVVSSKFLEGDDFSPARQLLNLDIYRSVRTSNGNRISIVMRKQPVTVLVSICGELMSYDVLDQSSR
jgi:hypothetical protein